MMIADTLSVFNPLEVMESARSVLMTVLSGLVILLYSAAGIWISGLLWKLWRAAVVKLGWDFERNDEGYIVEDGLSFEDEGDLNDYRYMRDHPDEWNEEEYLESVSHDD